MASSSSDEDIAQQLIAAGLCSEVKSRSGSRWTTDSGECFVKLGTGGASADAALLLYEAEGLRRMAAAAPSLAIPKPWLAGKTMGAEGFLVMDCELRPRLLSCC
eukprot:COSAG01_NODE_15787_length_1300_cov_1.202331_2_plen_104_part_00